MIDLANNVVSSSNLGLTPEVEVIPLRQEQPKRQKYRIIRKAFPIVRTYFQDDHEYFQVDCRNKKWGLKHRKNFNSREDALDYARKIEADILQNRSSVANNLIYQNKDIERFDQQLKVHGKNLNDAVAFYLEHLDAELKRSHISSITELCQKWVDEKCTSKKKPLAKKTQKSLKMYAKYITYHLGEYKPYEVTTKTIDDLLEKVASGESNVTRKHYFKHIRMFFRWCVKHQYATQDPTDRIDKITLKKTIVEILTPADVERLLRLVETKYPKMLGFFCLSLFAGLRPSEAEVVTWEHLHFDAKDIEVVDGGKTGPRNFSLRNTDNLWLWLDYIKQKRPNEPLNPVANHENLRKKVHKEFGGWIQDGLRHCFGTYYYKLNQDLQHLIYVMGNSVPIAKQHYLNRGVSDAVCQEYWALKPDKVFNDAGNLVKVLSKKN